MVHQKKRTCVACFPHCSKVVNAGLSCNWHWNHSCNFRRFWCADRGLTFCWEQHWPMPVLRLPGSIGNNLTYCNLHSLWQMARLLHFHICLCLSSLVCDLDRRCTHLDSRITGDVCLTRARTHTYTYCRHASVSAYMQTHTHTVP